MARQFIDNLQPGYQHHDIHCISLIEIYGVMRRHGVEIVASDDNFVNIFVNSEVMDNTNMIEVSPNQVLVSDWMRASRNLIIEGLYW